MQPLSRYLGDRSVLDITWTMGAGLIIAIIAAASGVVTSIVLMLKKIIKFFN